ncbi:MAG: glutamyl-tRNA reductase [Bacteroidota bacterium]
MMNVPQFYVIGINYRKTDTAVRGNFAINSDQHVTILQQAKELGIKELFVLSTCNRTELYSLAPDADTLIRILCSQTEGNEETFRQLCYIKSGISAIEHMFSVGAGLDSQILGDYEIVGQMKIAAKFAKGQNMIGCFIERLLNTVLQASKLIKNETELSNGTVSVSFAAIQFIKEHLTNTNDAKIVLIGTGKIGSNTCKNLIDYVDTKQITVINRTDEKALQLSETHNISFASYADYKTKVAEADVVIVATNSDKPIIDKNDLKGNKQILVDLSIPNNIDPNVAELANVVLANVDDLAKINDETLKMRLAEVPKALAIINTHKEEFLEWNAMRKHVPLLKAVKQKLMDMHNCQMFLSSLCCQSSTSSLSGNQDAIQKVVNNVAVKMKQQTQPGCHYIQAIHDYISAAQN